MTTPESAMPWGWGIRGWLIIAWATRVATTTSRIPVEQVARDSAIAGSMKVRNMEIPGMKVDTLRN